jgi:hypothetical protein
MNKKEFDIDKTSIVYFKANKEDKIGRLLSWILKRKYPSVHQGVWDAKTKILWKFSKGKRCPVAHETLTHLDKMLKKKRIINYETFIIKNGLEPLKERFEYNFLCGYHCINMVRYAKGEINSMNFEPLAEKDFQNIKPLYIVVMKLILSIYSRWLLLKTSSASGSFDKKKLKCLERLLIDIYNIVLTPK